MTCLTWGRDLPHLGVALTLHRKMRKINVVYYWRSQGSFAYLRASIVYSNKQENFLHVLKALISYSCSKYFELFVFKVSGCRKRKKV